MNHVATDVDGQIATDGSGLSFQGLGGTDQLAGAGDHAITFPTMATTGPEVMKSTKPAKNGRSL